MAHFSDFESFVKFSSIRNDYQIDCFYILNRLAEHEGHLERKVVTMVDEVMTEKT